MLPERDQRLLTACVDGELGPCRRRLVRCLVRRSPEARRLLRELEQDARALRSLPPVHLDADLSPYFSGTVRGGGG
jgi:anti-sigma factor RsiW